MKFEEKLMRLRKSRGMSQRALAEALHVARQSVSGWERGTAFPTLENLTAMAKLFGVPLETLTDESAPLPGAPETPEEEAAAEEPSEEKPARETQERKSRLKKRAALFLVVLCLLLIAAASVVYLWRTFFPETAQEDEIVWQEDMLPEIVDMSKVVDMTENSVTVVP